MVGLRKGSDQRPDAVGIGSRERWMAHQGADAIERCSFWDDSLERKPFVDNQRVCGVTCVKIVKGRSAFRTIMGGKRFQRGHSVGHIVGLAILVESALDRSIGFG